ncbi:hypothetical protein [Pseudomonas sp. NBRC 111121]|uniref:hypothetical protein n=1 Tax=Pseudomonas sp. NBRC 111121 TaxID=1661036 RepID=UPI000A84416B|nr:hypothetical protein [Pseudomonas sp. NBRC 111121]
MRINKLWTTLLLAGLLAGCSEGDRIDGYCGVRADNPNVVVASNSEVCAEDSETNYKLMFNKGYAIASVPDTDEAKIEAQKRIDASPSMKATQDEGNSQFDVASFAINSMLILICIALMIVGTVILLISRSFVETDESSGESNQVLHRYPLWAWGVPQSILVFLCMPYYYDEDDVEHTVVAQALLGSVQKMARAPENVMLSNILASIQSGSVTHNTLSEESRVYTATRSKARSIAINMVRAEQQDLNTGHMYLELKNYGLPVVERKTEFLEDPIFTTTSTGFTIHRPTIDNQINQKKLTDMGEFYAYSNIPIKAALQSKMNLIGSSYLTNDAAQAKEKLTAFKAELLASMGMTKPNQDINNAVIKQSSAIVKLVMQKAYIDNRPIARRYARLVLEESCAWPDKTMTMPMNQFIKEQTQYIAYLTGETDDVKGSRIQCVGEPYKGKFIAYGTRSREVVQAEKKEVAKELVAAIEPIIEQLQAAQILSVIDEVNSNACVTARKHGGSVFAANLSNCIISTKQNNSMVEAISNYSFTAYGGTSYIDTSNALAGNQRNSTLTDKNYDDQILAGFESVKSEIDLSQTNSEEAFRMLVENNLGDETGMMSYVEYLLNPFSKFKEDMGWTKECENQRYKCVDSVKIFVAINNAADRMITAGAVVSFSSIAISTLAKKVEKMTDKSREHSNYSGKAIKDSNPMSRAVSALTFILKMFTAVANVILAAGLLLKYVLVIPTLVFVLLMVVLIWEVLFKFLFALAMFVRLAWPMDRAARKAFVGKLILEITYTLTIKPFAMLLMTVFFFTWGLTLYGTSDFIIRLGSGGFKEAVMAAIMYIPIIYAVTVAYLKGTIVVIQRYAQFLGGGSTMSGVEVTLKTAFNLVTFGVPLILIWLSRNRKRERRSRKR